jgi:hypothetical protein
MTRSTAHRVPKEFQGLRGILRFNWQRFQSQSPRRRAFVAFVLVAWVALLTLALVDIQENPRASFQEQCRTKCSPLSYRVEVTLLNPFIGADQRRNVRSTTCVCGTAP